MFDVYFYEAFEEEADSLRRYLPRDVNAGFTDRTVQEAGGQLPPAALISTRTQSRFPVPWATELDGILTRSTGYDHLLQYRRETGRDLACGYLPLYCNRSVAEQALLLWMALLRKLRRQIDHFHTFNRDGLTGGECRGKTLAVVGVGNIGSEIARIGQGLGMTVMGVDLVEKHSFVKYSPLREALVRADILVCAMNLTPDNHSFFNYERLKLTRPGVIFINIARGEMSPAVDLLRLLDEGHLGGLGMDVYNKEADLGVALRSNRFSGDSDIKATLELSGRERVIFTPHNAFNTAEAVQRKSEQSIEQVVYFLAHGKFMWPVPEE